MANFNCPNCGKPLAQRTRKDGSGTFWSCTGYPDCKFVVDDFRGEPFLATCPECGRYIKKGVSKKTGKPYTACMNKEGHKDGQPKFFADDGSERGEESQPKAKADFTCPECGELLLYRKIRNGKHAGENVFICKNEQAHKDGKAKFFNDNGGAPLI